jgi:5-methylthioadenosine/S-adenosylhomocysteine deaminase
MRCAHIGVFLGLVIGVVAASYGQALHTSEQAANVEGGGYLIQNASLVLTMDPKLGDESILGQLKDADVLIVADTIVEVGMNLAPPSGVNVIDGRGMIVMPGFVDTHDHTLQSVIRGCAADDDIVGWLVRCPTGLRNSPITEDELYAGVRLTTAGLIDTGVTTGVDWGGRFALPLVRGNVRALVDSNMRFAYALFGLAADGSDIAANSIAIKQEFIDPNPLATLQVATAPAPFFATHVAEATQVALSLGVKLHFHLLEHVSNVAENPLQILQNAGAFALGRDLHAAHFVHASDSDIATLASLQASVAHNPLSNMRLASGIMRYPDVHNAGIRLGLGLDGGTNDTTDMFNNMRVAVGLQRAKSLDPHISPTVSEVLRAATMGGAETLDMESQIGSLTPGKQADVIVIDPRMLNFAP